MIGAPTIKSALVEDEKTISNLQIQVQSLEQTAHAKSQTLATNISGPFRNFLTDSGSYYKAESRRVPATSGGSDKANEQATRPD